MIQFPVRSALNDCYYDDQINDDEDDFSSHDLS